MTEWTRLDDQGLSQVHRRGDGVVFNQFDRRLHAASCRWVGEMTAAQPKYHFDDEVAAMAAIADRHGPEGERWRRCSCLAEVPRPGHEPHRSLPDRLRALLRRRS